MSRLIVGIDEVGRGPIAGPVGVGVFSADPSVLDLLLEEAQTLGLVLRDSKKLSEKKRDAWYTFLVQKQDAGMCTFSVSLVSAEEIDTIGIAPAIRQAIAQSLLQLQTPTDAMLVLDGGLKAPVEFTDQKTIIKGDETESAISLASIVAKVTRDAYMVEQSKHYPDYGFEIHKGYGTKKQYEALRLHGLCPLHRKTFIHL